MSDQGHRSSPLGCGNLPTRLGVHGIWFWACNLHAKVDIHPRSTRGWRTSRHIMYNCNLAFSTPTGLHLFPHVRSNFYCCFGVLLYNFYIKQPRSSKADLVYPTFPRLVSCSVGRCLGNTNQVEAPAIPTESRRIYRSVVVGENPQKVNRAC